MGSKVGGGFTSGFKVPLEPPPWKSYTTGLLAKNKKAKLFLNCWICVCFVCLCCVLLCMCLWLLDWLLSMHAYMSHPCPRLFPCLLSVKLKDVAIDQVRGCLLLNPAPIPTGSNRHLTMPTDPEAGRLASSVRWRHKTVSQNATQNKYDVSFPFLFPNVHMAQMTKITKDS